MMKNFMTSGALSKGKKPEGDPGKKGVSPFPREEAVMTIYGGPIPHESRRKLKVMSREVNVVSPATPMYLRWFECPSMFDQTDHPDCISKSGRFPLIVDPLVGMTRLTRVLMDGGSGINLIYFDTFERLGLGRDLLKTTPDPFYQVVPSKQFNPLKQIILLVSFRDASNYRTATLTFEVVNFFGPYHIILGQPCHIKFMAIPSYTYLKLKIPGPVGIITMEAKAQQALDCEQDNVKLPAAVVVIAELKELFHSAQPSSADPTMPAMSGTFNAEDPTKNIKNGAGLSLKQEGELIDFLRCNKDVFVWRQMYMLGVSQEVTKHTLNIKPGSKPVKQGLHSFNEERCKAIGDELGKLLTTGFVKEVQHPDWIANLVLVTKKGKWRMCVDYTSPNKACPKD
jgi:hypothetical protein